MENFFVGVGRQGRRESGRGKVWWGPGVSHGEETTAVKKGKKKKEGGGRHRGEKKKKKNLALGGLGVLRTLMATRRKNGTGRGVIRREGAGAWGRRQGGG